MSEFIAHMICCTDTILDEVAAGLNQRQIALSYALAIKSAGAKADTPDWPKINRAIIERWSMSGLERVKKMAFDICQGKVKARTPAG